MFRHECHRCGGKGFIRAFSHVLGGQCFACGGKGFLVTKHAHKPSKKFAISAIDRETGERVSPVFWISAKNSAEAVSKAAAKLAGGNGFIPESAAIADEKSA